MLDIVFISNVYQCLSIILEGLETFFCLKLLQILGFLKPYVDPKERIKLGRGSIFSHCIPGLFSQDLRSVNCNFPSMWFIISNQSLPRAACLPLLLELGHFIGPSLPGKSLGCGQWDWTGNFHEKSGKSTHRRSGCGQAQVKPH